MEFEASEEQKAQEQIIIPSHKDYPDLRYDPKDPVREGQKIEVVFMRDGVEEDRLSYVQDTAVGAGNEVRAFIKLVLAEMPAFTVPMENARVITSGGTVVEKAKQIEP